MKYNEEKFAKFVGGTGFFTILACCIIIIGAATWFAVSKYNSGKNQVEGKPQSSESYDSGDNTYNNNDIKEEIEDEPQQEVKNEASKVPYTQKDKEKDEIITNKEFKRAVSGEVCKKFSESELQYSATYQDMRLHTGTDFACEKEESVHAIGNGVVVELGEDSFLGKYITIDHGNGLMVKYCGIENPTVKAKEKLSAGDIIGAVGVVPGECAEQTHIHIEASQGTKKIDITEKFK